MLDAMKIGQTTIVAASEIMNSISSSELVREAKSSRLNLDEAFDKLVAERVSIAKSRLASAREELTDAIMHTPKDALRKKVERAANLLKEDFQIKKNPKLLKELEELFKTILQNFGKPESLDAARKFRKLVTNLDTVVRESSGDIYDLIFKAAGVESDWR